jgi:hypothetical protein
MRYYDWDATSSLGFLAYEAKQFDSGTGVTPYVTGSVQFCHRVIVSITEADNTR